LKISPVFSRYTRNSKRHKRVQTMLFRMALVKLKYVKTGHFFTTLYLFILWGSNKILEVQTKYKQTVLLISRLGKLLYLPRKSIIDFLWNFHMSRLIQCFYIIFKNVYVNKIFVNDFMSTHYAIKTINDAIDVFPCLENWKLVPD